MNVNQQGKKAKQTKVISQNKSSQYGDRKPPLKHNIKSKYNYGRLESTTSQKGVNLHFVDNNDIIDMRQTQPV